MKSIMLGIASVLALLAGPAHAQTLIESYVAHLSERDHFNSRGDRLRSAAAIIRQDRANFHRFGLRDPSDESDGFFSLKSNRGRLERLLRRGRAAPGVVNRIVNGTPFIRVNVYRSASGQDFVEVLVE
ncbi:MAG: hypothetical protein AAF732_09875 [Pseudomonadota bacterium]